MSTQSDSFTRSFTRSSLSTWRLNYEALNTCALGFYKMHTMVERDEKEMSLRAAAAAAAAAAVVENVENVVGVNV